MIEIFKNKPYHIFCGDVLDVLRTLPNNYIQCVVTSPPYWNLRDYGVEGQLGLEETPEEYVSKMVEVFREVRRVLRSDGTLWLNISDCYCSKGKGGKDVNRTKYSKDIPRGSSRWGGGNNEVSGLKNKDLIGISWMLAFALQSDGWYIRSNCIWNKPNPMPESVNDRPTSSYENIFLLTKSEKYFYDSEAVKNPALTTQAKCGKNSRANISRVPNDTRKQDAIQKGTYLCFNDRYEHSGMRNLRNVWNIPTSPYPEAHFATFPQNLVKIPLKASTSQHGCCAQCGAPWKRIVERTRSFESGSGRSGNLPIGKNGAHLQGGGETLDIRRGSVQHTKTLGWKPTCDCGCKEVEPCIVLDPFSGAGTTAMVAVRMGCRAIGIELNTEYVKMSEQRIENDMPLFTFSEQDK